jgi:hypothetical protein
MDTQPRDDDRTHIYSGGANRRYSDTGHKGQAVGRRGEWTWTRRAASLAQRSVSVDTGGPVCPREKR